MKYVVLFLNDLLDPKAPDLEYVKEYLAAKKYFPVGLIEQQQLFENDTVAINISIEPDTVYIYRGWMLKPGKYAKLVAHIQAHGGKMLTDLLEYEATHLIPNWAKNTPEQLKIHWTSELSDKSYLQLLQQFKGAVTIKDFVKSRKYEWADAFYIPDVSDTKHALQVIHNFIARQGPELVGGLVMREFIELKSLGEHLKSHTPIFEEYRIFYLNNEPLVVINYWNDEQITLSQADKAFIQKLGSSSRSNFHTIDLARKTDGQLIVMEMGDGQVSGLQDYDENSFYKLLWSELLGYK
ncbi:ATP-grasp domain-containing protein [Ligilactobacillus animalis]